jgi:methylated-DNA-[protein]-cysteine S-methyltransferase
MKKLYYEKVNSPLGDCIILATENAVYWTGTPGTPIEKAQKWAKHRLDVDELEHGKDNQVLQKAADELRSFFAGKKVDFSGPFQMTGTPFQKMVWKELCNIPYGEVKTYGQVAKAIGNPLASRAVGSANNKNPIAILVPCHRVVGSTGKLVGYAGGLSTKEWLLALEQKKASPK